MSARKVLELLTVFDWISPTVGLVEDIAHPGYTFFLDSKNYTKAESALSGVSHRGGHMHLGTYHITIDDNDIQRVTMILSAAGVKWRE